jgi:hypothetical protein
MAGAGPNATTHLTRAVTLGAVVLSLVYSALVMIVASPASFYTLDDPYIHMALAENLARGHFGVNLGEVSNPSSSILWPWLMAAFEKIGLMLWAPLLINIACFVATLRIAIAFCLPRISPEGKSLWALALIGAAILAFNVFGVMFTGMEHSLHVLLTVIVVTRAIDGKHDRLAFAAIVLCPLVRFEGVIALAFGAGAAVIDRRWLFAVSAVAASAALLGLYAMWLTSIGLPALPSSVLSKSTLSSGMVDGGGGLASLFANIGYNLGTPAAIAFILFAGLMVVAAIKRAGRDRWLSLGMLAALLLSFLAGKLDGYGRYEVHALTAAGLAAVHLYANAIRTVLTVPVRAIILCIGLVLVCLRIGPYVVTTAPLAARNIDRQQHQLHRIAECWRQPVAVNDLGWVSFRNDVYVLDLWGLGNEAARKARMSGESGWMERLVVEKDVGLAMIYAGWFPQLPQHWIPVAELGFDGPHITPAYRSVQIFATRPAAVAGIRACVEEISLSLPQDAWIKLAS